MNKLNVVFTIDDRFIQHFTVTMVSLLENNKDLAIAIFVLHDIEDQRKLLEVALFITEKYGIVLNYLYVNNALFERFRISLHYSKSVYYRLIITELLPESVEKVLFLDADIVVGGSLSELAAYKFKDNEYLLAVKNISNEDNVKRLNDLGFAVTEYFNAGVLLINVAAWRAAMVSADLIELACKYMEKIAWWDQDILNMFFCDKWQQMDVKYNTLLYADQLPEDPRILHFGGKEKPWLYVYDPPFKWLYWHYLKMTPFNSATYPDYSFKEFVRKRYIRLLNSLNLREKQTQWIYN